MSVRPNCLCSYRPAGAVTAGDFGYFFSYWSQPSYCSFLSVPDFKQLLFNCTSLCSDHFCDATQLLLPGPLSALVLPGSLVLGSSPCPLLFLVTSSFIPSLPTFRFLFEPSWHRLHFLYLQLSLGILSCAYLQDEDSQISLVLVSPCSCASNPSASSTALMGTYSERSVIFFSLLCHIPCCVPCSMFSLGGVFHVKFNTNSIHCFRVLSPHTSHLL